MRHQVDKYIEKDMRNQIIYSTSANSILVESLVVLVVHELAMDSDGLSVTIE